MNYSIQNWKILSKDQQNKNLDGSGESCFVRIHSFLHIPSIINIPVYDWTACVSCWILLYSPRTSARVPGTEHERRQAKPFR